MKRAQLGKQLQVLSREGVIPGWESRCPGYPTPCPLGQLRSPRSPQQQMNIVVGGFQ